MGGQISPKIVGATVVGFALVAGAYTISNFGESNFPQQPASIQTSTPVQRVAIAVTDNDNNGIEDWRDSFLENKQITVEISSTTYALPDTVTGMVSIQLIEDIINSKLYAPIGKSNEQIIADSIKQLDKVAKGMIFQKSDIYIMEEWEEEDIINYANTLASILLNNNIPIVGSELDILTDIYIDNNTERLNDLYSIINTYKKFRDDTLKLPVPATLAKEHLDLINSYNAVYEDIEGMSLKYTDPMVSFVHAKRYLDDAQGLNLAFKNMYLALEDYPSLFQADSPALLFVLFSPDYQRNN